MDTRVDINLFSQGALKQAVDQANLKAVTLTSNLGNTSGLPTNWPHSYPTFLPPPPIFLYTPRHYWLLVHTLSSVIGDSWIRKNSPKRIFAPNTLPPR